MMMINDEIISNALKHYTHLHENPEVSFEEDSAATYIRDFLQKEKIPYEIAGTTGTIGLITGKDSSRTIALRADIDALPIDENADHPIRSHRTGVMRACGHDLHTSGLLGVAEFLNAHKDTLSVDVMLIFQDAEEVLTGGTVDILESPFSKVYQPGKAGKAIPILKSELGNDHIALRPKRMTTEHFARYSQVIPVTLIRQGVKGISCNNNLHNSGFYPELSTLKFGIQTLNSLVCHPETH